MVPVTEGPITECLLYSDVSNIQMSDIQITSLCVPVGLMDVNLSYIYRSNTGATYQRIAFLVKEKGRCLIHPNMNILKSRLDVILLN